MADQENTEPVSEAATLTLSCLPYRNQKFRLASSRSLFRDKLQCKNALFLDGGSATSFYSPSLGRNSNFLPLGPIIGVYGQKEP